VSFGGSPIATTIGWTDAFLSQYSSIGTNQWSKRLTSGATTVYGNSIAVDSSRNLVLTGYFQGTANFEGQSLSSLLGSSDVFVSKYSSAGTRLWTKSMGGSGGDVGYSVTIDSAGFPIVTGSFSVTASFNGTSLTSAGLSDIFLMKLSP
jgi:hypothetical protein